MKSQANGSVMFPGESSLGTKEQIQIFKKIHNATLKKYYETKIASLANHEMPLHLLKMMCQDVPVKSGNLDSKWERKWFLKKCMRFYKNRLNEIERSEKTGLFSFFSKF